MPAGVSVSSSGHIFVADGYGNRQVHKFNPNGEKVFSWGISGIKEGEFALVHQVDIDSQDRVYICDRSNRRVQIFDHDGNYINMWENLHSPGAAYCDRKNLVYIAEQGGRKDPGVSIFTEDGELVSRISDSRFSTPAGGPHGITLDSKGNIYTAELRKAPGLSQQRVNKYVKV